jgi:hypothetical protein
MNPAEIIATKLLGWFRHQNGTAYTHGPSGRIFFPDDAMEYPEEWPDLSDWNDIRRIEDALAEKGLYCSYLAQIAHIDPPEDLCAMIAPLLSDEALDGVTDYESRLEQAFVAAAALVKRATAEQCVAAALKVIEEAGL